MAEKEEVRRIDIDRIIERNLIQRWLKNALARLIVSSEVSGVSEREALEIILEEGVKLCN